MIRFFKSSFFVQYLAICLTGLILWGRAFFEPPLLPEPEGYVPFYSFLFSLISGFPVIRVILGYILVIFSAIMLNRLFYGHNIVQKNSSLTGFIFMILMSYYPPFLTIHPVNITVFFLLLIISQLLKSYNRTESLDLVYSASFMITIGSLFYSPFIFFFFFILISFIIFQTLKWRQLVSALFGLLTPYLFLAVYYFWFDQLIPKINETLKMFSFSMDLVFLKNPVYLVLSLLIIIGYFYTLVFGLSNRSEKTIEKKRKNMLVNWSIFFVLLSFPFSSTLSAYHIELTFITFSGLIAYYMLQIRKQFFQELILLILILFILANNLFFLWL
jgi:hypothetical protein